MPELPEVETIRKQLEVKIVGKTIKSIDVKLAKIFQGDVKDVLGAKITGVKRRAKVLIVELSNNKTLLVHFKLSGQFVFSDKKDEKVFYPQGIPFAGDYLPGKTTHVIFYFDDGSRLFYNDLRQFGWIKVNGELDKYGPEPFTPEFTLETFREICKKWGRPVKLLLMEQDKIAGVGNIYANEALFCAKIAPHKRARDLEEKEKTSLYDCILKVLEMGLKYGGSSGADEAFITPEGRKGSMQEHFNVYQRGGQPCNNKCGGTIRRMTLGGRGTFFCPKCQR